MKRTNLRQHFFFKNRRLLWLLALLLIGCVGGVVLYGSLQGELLEQAKALLPIRQVSDGFAAIVEQIGSACFQTACLLMALFLGGLSACGVLLSVVVPLFWGVGLGMTLAFYYSAGAAGVLLSAVLVLPPALPEAALLLIGCAQTWHMSIQITGQLLPRSAHCGGLWQDFRWYCTRFALLLPLLLCVGIVDVGMRMLFLQYFPAALWF